jgi:hypothetical protein
MTRIAAAKNRPDFDPHQFLGRIGEGRMFVLFPKKQTIFVQGDLADAVFYIQTGRVKLTVVSTTGKEATIGILGDGDFSVKVRLRAKLSAWVLPPQSRIVQFYESTRRP